MTTVAQEFLNETEAFTARARELQLADAARLYWYHTVDLGDGLITPGLYDYRATLRDFPFPDDMRGMTVLDVGSATGFFAFEFERRGARVVSTELPSLRDLDRFPGQSVENSLRKIERMIFPDGLDLESMRRGDSERELYRCLLDGPFRFCGERLRSRVSRCYSTIYDLTAEKTGVPEGFDLVFVGDVLVHTLYPLKALAALAPLCRGELVLAQMLPEGPQEPPAMAYVGGDDPDEDHISWWLPNRACLVQMLKKLGFREVEGCGWHSGILRPGGHPFKRAILRARKPTRKAKR
ncbi:MAG TPA: methyltransferase domain-containing protein [Bryobacteraceae bacterium]|nr:methyltransferase domain-containing protein [Bryobacteraceae bacterium]